MAVERLAQVTGTAVPLRGDNIDTDRIIPARFLRSVSFEGLEAHLFADDRAQAEAIAPGSHPFSSPRYADASILLVNANFGCGSSREHAPQAIRRRGIRAIVGQSFSEIFFGNSVALGMPCVSVSPEVAERLMQAVERDPQTAITIDLGAGTVSWSAETAPAALPGGARDAFLEGTWDATGLLLDRYEDVEAVAARLPYVTNFSRD
ncbi:MAG TPA: 3-isopropylmalate dehydratase small subunit [Vicinamibacterales bacterium]|nr:3-isopropylmalate dehydratase small subunit [Vicinamibacterales bacterium]